AGVWPLGAVGSAVGRRPLGSCEGAVRVHRLALSSALPVASGADFSPCIESSIAGHACAGGGRSLRTPRRRSRAATSGESRALEAAACGRAGYLACPDSGSQGWVYAPRKPSRVRQRVETVVKTLAFVPGLFIATVGAVGVLAPSSLVWIA